MKAYSGVKKKHWPLKFQKIHIYFFAATDQHNYPAIVCFRQAFTIQLKKHLNSQYKSFHTNFSCLILYYSLYLENKYVLECSILNLQQY